MKVELTNELKARFFALYWGQRVWPNQFTVDGQMNSLSEEAMDALFVELRPLSSITEEEAESLKEYKSFSFHTANKFVSMLPNYNLKEIKAHASKAIFLAYHSCEGADTLRRLGFALPFMGIPVDQWIEWGVVKLKEA